MNSEDTKAADPMEKADAFPTPRMQFEMLLAEKVMGWVLRYGDWHIVETEGERLFMSGHSWHPTSEALSSNILWMKILEHCREFGYEVSMEKDNEGRFHINGDHPVAKRLRVIDPDFCMAVCRFAALLFGIEPPHPYGHNPGGVSTEPPTYKVISGLQPPLARPARRVDLDALVEAARSMEIGDAVVLSMSQAQTFRVILAALGFKCVTDAYRCMEKGKMLVFKLANDE